MLREEGKEGIDMKDIMVAKMPKISKNLHEQERKKLDEGSEPW